MELALENLEKEGQSPMLSQEEQLWIRMHRELRPLMVCLHKDIIIELLRTADYERASEILTRLNLAEYQVVWYYQKPLKELSLKEVMDGIVVTSKMIGLLDTISCTDDNSHYTLKVTHSAGSISRLFKIFFEKLFEAYGAKTQSEVSENSLFVKVFKNL